MARHKAYRASGIAKPITPHSLRHALASHLLEAGTDVRRIHLLLGHCGLATTSRYVKIANSTVRAATSPLDLLPEVPPLQMHPLRHPACSGSTFNPLAVALPERNHPQRVWLQCRYASVMSYRRARIFLRDAFPGMPGLLPVMGFMGSGKVGTNSGAKRLKAEGLYCEAARQHP